MNLIEIFDERTQGWEEQLSRDEWFFTKLRDEIIEPLSSAEAFELLPQAATLVLRDQEYDYRVSECVQLLLSLARHSDTTELPPELSPMWQELMSRISSFGDSDANQAVELCRWYRKELPTKRYGFQQKRNKS